VTGQELVSGPGGYSSVPDISDWDSTWDKKGCVTRPELRNMGRAMVGGGKLYGDAQTFGMIITPLLQHFNYGTWNNDLRVSLRKDAVVVDVCGGVGE
jgi:hypothetical protein